MTVKKRKFANYKFRCHSLKSIVAPIYNKYMKDKQTVEEGIVLPKTYQKDYENSIGKDASELTKGQKKAVEAYNNKKKELDLIVARMASLNYDFCYSKLYELVSTEIFNIKPIITTKSITRGIEQEDESIDMLSKVFNNKFTKNVNRQEDDYLSGEADVLHNISIIDIKTCETRASFDDKSASKASSDYKWQLYAYKRLYNKEKGFIAYTLPSYNKYVIKKIILNHFNKKVSFEDASYYYDQFVQGKKPETNSSAIVYELYDIFIQEISNHNFDRIPLNLRVKVFEVYDDIDHKLVNAILDKQRQIMDDMADRILEPQNFDQITF